MEGASLRDFIMTIPYKTDGFVAVKGGSLHFGTVKFSNGVLRFDDCVVITYHRITEFLEFLKKLGSNIVMIRARPEEKETATMELGGETKLLISDTKIVSKGRRDFELDYDHFTYIHFLKSVSQIVLFVVNPTSLQFSVFRKYLQSNQTEEHQKIEEAINIENTNADEKFLLREMIRCNMPLLNFCQITSQLSTVNV